MGAGQGGYNVIRSLINIEDIKINMVIDRDMDAVGIKLAKEQGIRCSKSIEDINSNDTDLILEVTGNKNVSKLLWDKFKGKCTILDSQAALLIISLVKKNNETLAKLNNSMETISVTSNEIEQQLKQITASVDSIHKIGESLGVCTNNSNEYIMKTDEIVKYVDKMSKHTKILGLNAAIQAARAGEQGKGFSVVATEIQKLAENNKSFSLEIVKILNQLSEEVKKIRKETDKLNQLSEAQVSASDIVNSAVDRLVKETS